MDRREERVAFLMRLKDAATKLKTRFHQHQTKVFDTYEDMVEWLRNDDNIKSLKIGQTLYIRERNTRNYWFAGDEILPLKTKEIDMSWLVKHSEAVRLTIHQGDVVFRANEINPSTSDPHLGIITWSSYQFEVGEPLLIKTCADNGCGEYGGTTNTTSNVFLTVNNLPEHTHRFFVITTEEGHHTHAINLGVVWQPGFGLSHSNLDIGHNAGSIGDYFHDFDRFVMAEGGWPNGSGGTYQIHPGLSEWRDHTHKLNCTTGWAGLGHGHNHTYETPAIQLKMWEVMSYR